MEPQHQHPDLESGNISMVSCGYMRDPFNVLVLNRPLTVTLKFHDPNRTAQDATNWVQSNVNMDPNHYTKVVNNAQRSQYGDYTVQVTFNDPNLNPNAATPVHNIVIANITSIRAEVRPQYPADFEQPYETFYTFVFVVPMQPAEEYVGEVELHRLH